MSKPGVRDISAKTPNTVAGGMAAGDPGVHSTASRESSVRQPGGSAQQHRGQPYAEDPVAGRGPADGRRHGLRHDSQAGGRERGVEEVSVLHNAGGSFAFVSFSSARCCQKKVPHGAIKGVKWPELRVADVGTVPMRKQCTCGLMLKSRSILCFHLHFRVFCSPAFQSLLHSCLTCFSFLFFCAM